MSCIHRALRIFEKAKGAKIIPFNPNPRLTTQMKAISHTLLTAVLLFLLACTPSKPKPVVSIAMVDWSECVSITQLARAILEDKGYEVNLVLADIAPAYQAVAHGDADLFLDSWEPYSHEPYIMKYENQLDQLGVIFDKAQIGFVVPSYVTIDSVSELNNYVDQFNRQIIGASPGSGILNLSDEVIREYKLNYSIVSSSENKMLELLRAAIAEKRWIVVTAWEPHPMFVDFDLKFLKETHQIFGRNEAISITATKGWADDHPELAHFFKNFRLNYEQIHSLMKQIQEAPGNEYQAAKSWYHLNKDLVDSWFM